MAVAVGGVKNDDVEFLTCHLDIVIAVAVYDLSLAWQPVLRRFSFTQFIDFAELSTNTARLAPRLRASMPI